MLSHSNMTQREYSRDDERNPIGRESATLVFFDAGHRPVHVMQLEGAADRVTLPWRHIISVALTQDCRCILLQHTHTLGDPRPSDRDIMVMRALCRILRPLELRLCDHLIRAGERAF